jgi:hypothetical protein
MFALGSYLGAQALIYIFIAPGGLGAKLVTTRAALSHPQRTWLDLRLGLQRVWNSVKLETVKLWDSIRGRSEEVGYKLPTSMKVALIILTYLVAIEVLYRTEMLSTVVNYNLMGTIFIGYLCIVGSFLFLYKGFTILENSLLNIAGISAIFVALFPTGDPSCPPDRDLSLGVPVPVNTTAVFCGEFNVSSTGIGWHGLFAGIFFATGTLTIVLCSRKTLKWLRNDSMESRYRNFYWLTAIVMIASPATAWIVSEQIGRPDYWIFWLELGGMLAFVAYWWVKSDEIKRFGGDTEVVRADVPEP